MTTSTALLTDRYELTMLAASLRDGTASRPSVFELFSRRLSGGRRFGVVAGTGRLLGAQIVGREDAAKRIDVLATAIWNEMDVDEVLSLDLSYAPPFSPVWDPVLIAARKASEALHADRKR